MSMAFLNVAPKTELIIPGMVIVICNRKRLVCFLAIVVVIFLKCEFRLLWLLGEAVYNTVNSDLA